jgi:hypothetical protein
VDGVVIGMDPQKRSATIGVLDQRERAGGRFGTDQDGYRQLLAAGVVGRTRRQLASELIAELTTIDRKIKAADTQLRELVAATGSTLLELHGIGPSGAAPTAR